MSAYAPAPIGVASVFGRVRLDREGGCPCSSLSLVAPVVDENCRESAGNLLVARWRTWWFKGERFHQRRACVQEKLAWVVGRLIDAGAECSLNTARHHRMLIATVSLFRRWRPWRGRYIGGVNLGSFKGDKGG